MKLHFEANLDYQLQAIEAVCGLFHGQEICRTEFTVTRDVADAQARMSFVENELGTGNRLTLIDDEILANLHAIQLKNGLPPSASLDSGDFTVEMETGTGKTYVYLRTAFELHPGDGDDGGRDQQVGETDRSGGRLGGGRAQQALRESEGNPSQAGRTLGNQECG